MTNTNHDTYEQALTAVTVALDALADEAAVRAVSHDPGDDDYDSLRHHLDSGRCRGVHDALAIATGMLSDYRTERRAGVA